jgi:GTP-binding protein
MIDVAYIKIKGGNGGDGTVSFRHERHLAKGGPDGGDGGNGGDVYFIADNNLATLKDFKSKEIFKAEDGNPGGRKKMSGSNGEDIFVKVPLGTLIHEVKGDREILVCDLSDVGQKYLVAKGGVGGRGNHRFKSPINQTPLQYTEGIKGEEKKIKLEIKLIADVGLVGMPNAGKSTLINRLTNANAKVASYPFTTLTPNLGMCRLKSGKTIVLSDIPGLIEGASKGRGLGDEFLRHIQRTRVLIHIIDVCDASELSAKDLAREAMIKYDIIRSELKDYDETLAKKSEIVVVNKVDITEVKDALSEIIKEFKKKKIKAFGMSAATGEGIGELIEEAEKVLDATPKVVFETAKPTKVYNIDNLPNRKIVFKERRVIEMVRPKH